MGIKDNLVTKSGMTYAFGNMKLGVGFEAARGFLKENPKIGKELLKQITKN